MKHDSSSSLIRRSLVLAGLSLSLNLGALSAGEPLLQAAVNLPAEPPTFSQGFYFEGFGGFSGLMDDGIQLNGERWDGEYGGGFLGGGAIGHQWRAWSLELEFFYRSNDIDAVSRGGDRFAGGDYASTNFFLNAHYTFGSLGGRAAIIRPYVGAGVGLMQEIDIDMPGLGVEDVSATWKPAFQAIFGVRWELNAHWSIFTEGRYTYAGDPKLRSETGASQTVRADYKGWTALAGLRWTF
jgi:opacity protein-like surface antigen